MVDSACSNQGTRWACARAQAHKNALKQRNTSASRQQDISHAMPELCKTINGLNEARSIHLLQFAFYKLTSSSYPKPLGLYDVALALATVHLSVGTVAVAELVAAEHYRPETVDTHNNGWKAGARTRGAAGIWQLAAEEGCCLCRGTAAEGSQRQHTLQLNKCIYDNKTSSGACSKGIPAVEHEARCRVEQAILR